MKCEAEGVDNASHVASKWFAPFQAALLLGKFSCGKFLSLALCLCICSVLLNCYSP